MNSPTWAASRSTGSRYDAKRCNLSSLLSEQSRTTSQVWLVMFSVSLVMLQQACHAHFCFVWGIQVVANQCLAADMTLRPSASSLIRILGVLKEAAEKGDPAAWKDVNIGNIV